MELNLKLTNSLMKNKNRQRYEYNPEQAGIHALCL